MFESDLGAKVLDEFAHYADIERTPIERCLCVLDIPTAAG
jgi:uncharacterized glyoxalase superfamily metalloenzyme YdcJ